jgi:hypothetical protein
MSALAVPVSVCGLSRTVAASAMAIVQAMAVGRPGRRAASRRRGVDCGWWGGAVGMVWRSGALERGEGERCDQAPELDGGGHPAGFVVVHGVLVGLDGHELLGVDVLGRHTMGDATYLATRFRQGLARVTVRAVAG